MREYDVTAFNMTTLDSMRTEEAVVMDHCNEWASDGWRVKWASGLWLFFRRLKA